MKTYQEIINDICTNDATIQAVATGITLYRWFRGAAQDAIDSGRIVRRWWDNHGRTYATMAALVLLLVACAVAAGCVVVYQWVRDHGVPAALTAADITCRFLLCYESPVEPLAEGGDPGFVMPEPEALVWAKERWPQLAA